MSNFSEKWVVREDPVRSAEWQCFLFGSKDGSGIVYTPPEHSVPNWFVRWMMKVCLGCTWVRTKKEK